MASHVWRAQGPEARLWAHDLELMAHRAWDVAPLTLQTGIGLGLSVFDQRFETSGTAHDQLALAPFVAIGLGATWNFAGGFHGRLSADGQTHFLRLIEAGRANPTWQAAFAVRAGLAFGKHF